MTFTRIIAAAAAIAAFASFPSGAGAQGTMHIVSPEKAAALDAFATFLSRPPLIFAREEDGVLEPYLDPAYDRKLVEEALLVQEKGMDVIFRQPFVKKDGKKDDGSILIVGGFMLTAYDLVGEPPARGPAVLAIEWSFTCAREAGTDADPISCETFVSSWNANLATEQPRPASAAGSEVNGKPSRIVASAAAVMIAGVLAIIALRRAARKAKKA